ncbi:MAG: glycosyltransferase family 4 protein [Candidatus Omnitrophota bacterium]
MNVLILSKHLNAGGITRYIMTLTKGLKQKGHNVFVATSGGDLVDDLILCGAKHIFCNINTKSELSPKVYFALGKLAKLIRKENIDVIHTQTRVTQVMGELLSKLTKKPHISTCHGFFKKRLSRKLFPCWGRAVVAISEAVKTHLIHDFNVPEEKVFLIHHGLDLDEFAPIDEAVRQAKRQELHLGQGPVIGNIARLVDVKGHDTLISAMTQVVQKIPQARLLIVGQGPKENVLRKMVIHLKLENHVYFYPVVNKTADILPVFDIFVMPSTQEGFGLSAMEAQAVGLPVIASDVGGLPTLIEHGKTGFLVPPGDANALAAMLFDLVADMAKTREVGLAARKNVENKFSQRAMVEHTCQIYENLIYGRK